jgi:Rhamnan synthesis protein F
MRKYSFKDFRWGVESVTIIPLVEGLVRLWFHLDPRVYSERLRIRSITEGDVEKKSNRYVVLALYEKVALPTFTMNLINAIDRSALNLIVVSNSALSPMLKAQLHEKCHMLIERSNFGRDFGAYRDGICILLRRFKNIERLVLLNNSLFYFNRGLDDLVARLNGEAEFVGVTEVFQFHYHVQSYALSFGAQLLRNKSFLRFWRRYRPISSRRWSIHKGEVRLTRKLTKAGFRPHILYQAAELALQLATRPIREVLESVRLLPTDVRSELYEEFGKVLGTEENRESLSTIETISQGVRDFKAGHNAGENKSSMQSISDQAETMERWSFEIFTNRIISAIVSRNQIHAGGFFFVKYLGLPIIKRDIFYREVYALEDIHRILSEFEEPLRDEVMADLRRGGTGANLKGLWRTLYNHGSI